MQLNPEVAGHRKAEHDISPIFLNRWSPSAMTSGEISEKQLMSLLEAGRWAPSSYNNQPWRFIYGLRGTPAWDLLFGLLGDYNRKWAANASALVMVISKKTFDFNGKPSKTHSFDTGAAWMSIALEASISGVAAHGMEGFDYDKARTELGIPNDYDVEAMFAVGIRAPRENLPPDLAEREVPSGRRPLKEIVMEGRFR